jgi:multiple sugar transport system substrate-binding protein
MSSFTRRQFLVDGGKLVAGASVFSSVLAACGGSSNNSTSNSNAPVTLSYWCLFYQKGTPSGTPIDSAVADFKKTHSNITINVTGWSGDQAGFTKLTQAIQAGGTVDFFRVSADELPVMVQQGLVAPTDSFLSASDKSDIYPNILQDVSFNGKPYAWPMYVPPVGMYLNLDIFKERNITPPSDNWTYDEFVEIAQKLTFTRSDGTKVYGYTGQVDAGVLNTWPIIMCDGGAPLSSDNKTYTFNSPQGVSGLQKLVDLVHKYKVTPPDFGTQTVDDIRSGFSQRKVYAMYSEPSGAASVFAKTAGLNFAIKPMPIGGRGVPFTCGGIGLIAVAALQDQNRLSAAMQAAQYLSGSQVAKDVPGYYTAPPVRKSVQIGPPASDFSPMVAYTWLAPMIEQWDAIRLLIQPALQKAILGQQSPQDALNGPASQINSLLSSGS